MEIFGGGSTSSKETKTNGRRKKGERTCLRKGKAKQKIHGRNSEGARPRRPCTQPYGMREMEEEEVEQLDVWTELDPDYLDKL